MPKTKNSDLDKQIADLTADLQRTRADFENYRKRVDGEKYTAFENGQTSAVLKLLPVVDNIERAIAHEPEDIKDHKWVVGVVGLSRSLEKSLYDLGIERIDAKPGTEFNPELHDAVQLDEEAKGQVEVIAEELQAGYTLNGNPIRHAMVKVTKK